MGLCWLKVYLILWTVLACSGDSQREGRFQSIKSIDGEEETLFLSTLRLIGKQRLLNGTLTFLTDLDDNTAGEMVVYSLKNGEWIQSSIKGADSDLPSAGKNCIKKGTYYLKNVQASCEHWPAFLASGLTKFIIQVINFEGKRIGGVEAVFYLSS